jgi:hypothetical protein
VKISGTQTQQGIEARETRVAKTISAKRLRNDLAAWAIAIIALLANAPVVSVDYVFDDHPIVEDSERVNELQLGRIWSTSYWDSSRRLNEYRPLVVSSYAIERALLGPTPGHYHAVNWLLHALVAVSVLFAGRAIRLTESAAVVAAALFAVHPIHLDAIAPIVGRAELLAALAMTGGIYFWIRVRTVESPSIAGLLGLGGCIGVGAFSKESALAVIPVIAAVEWLVVDRPGNRPAGRPANGRTALAATAMVAIVVAGYLVARVIVLGSLLPSSDSSFTVVANPLVGEDLSVRLLTAASIFGHYLRIFAWPNPLSPDYSFDSLPVIRAAAEPWFWLPFAIGATGVVGAVASIRRAPLLAIAAAVFIAPYSIVSNSAFLIGTMLAERLFYLPSIGICWAIGFALAALVDRASPGGGRFPGSVRTFAIAAIPIALLGSMSFKRAQDWQNEELLYHQALQTYPRNTGMWLTLGEIAIRTGRYPLAIERMGRVIEIVPDFTKAWLDRGTLLAALGQNQAAAADLRRAIELNPDDLLALENLAVVERQLGNHAEAAVVERRAAGLRSRHGTTLRSKAVD